MGLFPMDRPGETGPVGYYEADPRAVMPIEGFRVPPSVARVLRRTGDEIRVDADFDGVVAACADRREGVWLTERLAAAYRRLHREGIAHSVEAWRGERLVGGLFGVALGGLFTSESMFHSESDAGHSALVGAAGLLRRSGFVLWDIQMASDHTRRFGAVEIPRRDYRRALADALRAEPRPLAG